MVIARGCFVLTILASCVLSLPVTQSRLENEDVKVMKCIVEALADVLSRPHPLPVSQECLDTLKTDERLVSILRHRNFLKELQDIAVQGSNERSQRQGDITADHVTKTPPTPQSTEDVADRSMLEALGGPGERSILAEKRGTAAGEREVESTEKDEESQEANEIREEEEEEKREKDENPDNHISDAMNEEEKEGAGGAAEKKEEEEEEEEEEKRDSSEEGSEENEGEGDKRDGKPSEKNDAPERPEEKKSAEDEEEEEEEEEDVEKKRSALFSSDSAEEEKEGAEEEDEGEVKRGKSELAKRRAGEAEGQELRSLEVTGQQEVPHHSREAVGEEEEGRRSPEVKELQMMARRVPEERRAGEEEGSASRKTEDPEIEGLAAIESELENVAEKLHELRRG